MTRYAARWASWILLPCHLSAAIFPETDPQSDQSWDESLFYVWQYERPTSLFYYIGAVALPIGALR